MWTISDREVRSTETRLRFLGSDRPPCSMAFMSSSRKADATSSWKGAGRSERISRMNWVVRSAASSLQHIQSDPIGLGRNDADIVFGEPRVERLLDDLGDHVPGEWFMDVAEGPFADGADHALRILIAGDDHTRQGPNGVHAADELQSVIPVAALSGNHNVHREIAQKAKGFLSIGRGLDAAV